MGARPAVSWIEAAQALDDAAAVIEHAATLDADLHDNAGGVLGRLTPRLARPIALNLRASAGRIRLHRATLGLPVSYDLEIAGAVLGRDLGHNR